MLPPPLPSPCSPEGRGGGGGSGTDWAAEKEGVAWAEGAWPEDLEWLDMDVGEVCSEGCSDSVSPGCCPGGCCRLHVDSGVVSVLTVCC